MCVSVTPVQIRVSFKGITQINVHIRSQQDKYLDTSDSSATTTKTKNWINWMRCAEYQCLWLCRQKWWIRKSASDNNDIFRTRKVNNRRRHSLRWDRVYCRNMMSFVCCVHIFHFYFISRLRWSPVCLGVCELTLSAAAPRKLHTNVLIKSNVPRSHNGSDGATLTSIRLFWGYRRRCVAALIQRI